MVKLIHYCKGYSQQLKIKLYYFCLMSNSTLPSFFKSKKNKEFHYKPRYWDKYKEQRNKSNYSDRLKIKFKTNNRNHTKENAVNKRIVLLIIILSLLMYYLFYY